MTPVLELKNVHKNFGGVKAIDDFSVVLEPGKIHGLIGPNGAGKTTIFNNITGIYAPTKGEIFLSGQNITSKKPHEIAQMGIGRTFQNIRLFTNLSAVQNVIIASNLHANYSIIDSTVRSFKYRKEEQKIRERAHELLDIVGLLDKSEEKSGSLPYGHQRRLEIARAMALDPKLLLLDEPAAGMNGDENIELIEFIKAIKKRFGLTILMIEHHMDVVTNLCDSVTVLNFGKTISSGTPSQVKSDKNVIDAYLGGDE